jgi:hypothetical protein
MPFGSSVPSQSDYSCKCIYNTNEGGGGQAQNDQRVIGTEKPIDLKDILDGSSLPTDSAKDMSEENEG